VIEALAGQGHSAKALCRMVDVAPSGFYYWRSKPPSIRELRHEQLGGLIADIHHVSRGTYGYRRVAAELRFGHEIIANHKAVAALMRRLGLHGLPTRKPRRKGPQNEGSAASDLVLRQFSAEAPNRLWMTDITEHPTREGKLYCCAVLDAYSRSVVGWSIDNQQAASLVTSALGMAISRREPRAGGIVHSDHGSHRAGSTSPRNTLSAEVLMGRPAGWMAELTGRAPMKSPGKPSLRRDVERLFWREIAKGSSSEDAALGRRCVFGGRQPVVQGTWRDANIHARTALRALSVV
jgi:putative transposase